jgi:predicted RNA polymerase sigma factor
VIDALRKAAWFAPSDELDDKPAAEPRDEDGDLLAMMLVCCHPAIPVEGALVLALRTLCGFPVPALCRALFAESAAVEKRLARARQVLRDERVAFEPGAEADVRVDSVLRTLYVLFLEGYSAHAGPAQIDVDLCATAIRLNELLLAGRFASPAAHALQALFLLQASRFAARTDDAGGLVPLHLQDRTRWDRRMIDAGLAHLAASASGSVMTAYHVEAAIAACHATAATYDATPWGQIVELYDRLLVVQPSPVVALQRAIAVGRAAGPRKGLEALERIGDDRLADSAVLAAAAGDLKERLGDKRGAIAAYRRALELVGTDPERRFLEAKLAELS